MIGDVSLEGASYAELPAKYEAGTPPLVEAHGLGIAIDYMNKIGLDNIIEHENEITKYAFNKLNDIDFIEIHGGDNKRNSIISFGTFQPVLVLFWVRRRRLNPAYGDNTGYECWIKPWQSLTLPMENKTYSNKVD